MIELDATWTLIGLAVLVCGPGGAAWVGAKNSLNGFKGETRRALESLDDRCERIEGKVDELSGDVAVQREKTAHLEGKVGD